MKRALALALLMVVLLATPARAHGTTVSAHGSAGGASAEMAGYEDHDGGGIVDPDDDGADGTEPLTFAALALGGMALVAAVAALVMGRHRIPA